MAVNKFDNSMFDAGTIGTTANKLLQMDGSAKIPAVDGSLLTGIPPSFTKSASDPTISTNPSGGVGSLWANTTSGEVYCCTDATAGANIWTNIGAGTGDIEPWSYQGSVYGYSMMGYRGGYSNVIDRFSFTTDGNAVDVGDATVARNAGTGAAGGAYGYMAGGHTGSPQSDIIDRFAFGSSSDAADVGNLTVARGEGIGSSYDQTHHYCHGGNSNNVIDRYAFAASNNATDVGDLVHNPSGVGGACSPSYAYAMGGHPCPNNTIEKYSYAATATSTDVGDLYKGTTWINSNGNSQTYGYAFGGYGTPAAYLNEIQKWTYASNSNSTDVGDMIYTGNSTNCCSSQTHVYVVGGGNAGSSYTHIQKVPFATDGNSTDVGDLTAGAQTSMASCHQ